MQLAAFWPANVLGEVYTQEIKEIVPMPRVRRNPPNVQSTLLVVGGKETDDQVDARPPRTIRVLTKDQPIALHQRDFLNVHHIYLRQRR